MTALNLISNTLRHVVDQIDIDQAFRLCTTNENFSQFGGGKNATT